MKRWPLTVLALAALVSACSSASREARARPAPRTIAAGEISFESLPRQTLDPGQCGLFLWAQTEQPALVLVAFDDPAQAVLRPNGRDRTLRRTAVEGQARHGHYESQTYSDRGLTLVVDIHFDSSRELRGGAALERGVIRVRDDEGWETIVPVGGLVACEG